MDGARRWIGVAVVIASVVHTPSLARADVAPANVRGCDGVAVGAACTTDACNPGVCTTMERLGCKESDLAGCLLCRQRDAGACEDACATRVRPCVVCLPPEGPARARELAAASAQPRTWRFDDCVQRRAGDRCVTPACAPGECAAREGGEPTCAVPPPATPRAAWAGGAALLVAVTGVLVLLWRRRARAR